MSCPAGTYQDREGQVTCRPCPHRKEGVGLPEAQSARECGGRQQQPAYSSIYLKSKFIITNK